MGSGLIVLIDQVVKWIVRKKIGLHQLIEVIPGFFNLTHVRNTGGAFGLLAGGASSGFRMALFIGVSLLAIGMILYMYSKVQSGQHGIFAALIMILGGAVGNLIDRIRLGDVIDFLDFYIGTIHWPAFNIADSFITAGVALFCYYLFIKKVAL
jgi:signal peptidase II